MVEYLEDAIEIDPSQEYPEQMLENGISFKNTGDSTIDSWEKQLAEGTTPDFVKDIARGTDKALIEAWLKPKKQTVTTVEAAPEPVVAPQQDDELEPWMKEMLDGFSDDYKKGT